jgi:predicted transcriptional regulator of viral defense system
MKLSELSKIQKLYFGYEQIAKIFGISAGSAKVTASRYVRQGLLVRVRKNMYVLREVWNAADRETKFTLANLAQPPSYISLVTALDFYGITTQMQRDFFESVAVKRTKEIHVNASVFRYSKVTGILYFGFQKENSSL